MEMKSLQSLAQHTKLIHRPGGPQFTCSFRTHNTCKCSLWDTGALLLNGYIEFSKTEHLHSMNEKIGYRFLKIYC